MSRPLNRVDLLRLVTEDQRLHPGRTVVFVVTRRIGTRLVPVRGSGKVLAVERESVTVLAEGERLRVPRYGSPAWSWNARGLLPSQPSNAEDTVPLGEG